ncbi:hypothetical protein [Mycobacteroides abscessus]|uniref:hypothetical protein n=1 Tax=Mycobacteroides abscessus TaxID=36809 RepID=UPI000943A0FC|nr:hypothetical protein [Mycobacteroides abscessus]
MKPSESNATVIAGALGDPLAGVRLLEAIAADDELGDSLAGSFRRSHRSDLLVRASQHLPEIVVCEECADGSGYGHEDADDSCAGRCA